MANRLAASTSPYLLQHRDNPVDWWEWGEEAFAEARRRDRPILLSVGYAACHWCHVMAHESFDDPGTAELVNATTVPVKVDREERPDVDAVYMQALLATTGQGGWPMTALLTPDGEPFFTATYLPRAQFQQVLRRADELWRSRRDALVAQGRQLVAELARRPGRAGAAGAGTGTGAGTGAGAGSTGAALIGSLAGPGGTAGIDTALVATELARAFDPRWGGFGPAPKFPPSMAMEFLLRYAAGTGAGTGESPGTGAGPGGGPGTVGGQAGGPPSAGEALGMVATTAERMARGGIYDQLAGGFARYSTDAHWVVPHFEKMLYDNALLARVYAHLWRSTGSQLAARVAVETAEWMVAELGTPEGGLASSLDADSDGGEGRFYVWTPGQLAEALGDEELARQACQWLAVTGPGTFEHQTSVLQLPADPPDAQAWARMRAQLRAAREARPRPARDDKVVAAWNGLAVAALAEVGVLLERPALVGAAQRVATLVCQVQLDGGRLARTSRDGRPGRSDGVLEDYADLAEGLLVLHQCTGERRWLDTAGVLLERVLAHFRSDDGGFHDTADDAEPLVLRPADPADAATPSGASAAAGALLTYAALTGSAEHRQAALEALAALADHARRYPRFAAHAAAVAEAAAAGPVEVAVLEAPELARLARLTTSPGAVVVTGGDSPLLAGRPGGTASVCRGFACRAPVSDPAELAAELGLDPRAAGLGRERPAAAGGPVRGSGRTGAGSA